MTLKLPNYTALDRENHLDALPLQDSEAGLIKMFMFTGHSDSLIHTHRVLKNSGPPGGTIKAGSQCLKDSQRLSTSQSSHHFSAMRQPSEAVPGCNRGFRQSTGSGEASGRSLNRQFYDCKLPLTAGKAISCL